MTTDTKVKDVIVLKPGEAALVLKADETMDIIVPDGDYGDDGEETATPNAVLAVTLAYLVTTGDPVIFDALDHVGTMAEKIEAAEAASDAVSSDTDCCGSDSDDCDCNHGEPV